MVRCDNSPGGRKGDRAQQLDPQGTVVGVSHPGARPENQDYVLYGEIESTNRILVIADGISASKEAGRGAQIAASVIYAFLETKVKARESLTLAALEEGFTEAVEALRAEAQALRWDMSGCLATTLIVVVETPDRFLYGYVGNGSVVLFREKDTILDKPVRYCLLSPQVAGQRTAALSPPGPTIKPFLGTVRKSVGDVVVAGTDGLFDRMVSFDFFKQKGWYPPTYIYQFIVKQFMKRPDISIVQKVLDFTWCWLMRRGVQLRGISSQPVTRQFALKEALEEFTKELLEMENPQGGRLIEDNLTIGVIVSSMLSEEGQDGRSFQAYYNHQRGQEIQVSGQAGPGQAGRHLPGCRS